MEVRFHILNVLSKWGREKLSFLFPHHYFLKPMFCNFFPEILDLSPVFIRQVSHTVDEFKGDLFESETQLIRRNI